MKEVEQLGRQIEKKNTIVPPLKIEKKMNKNLIVSVCIPKVRIEIQEEDDS